MRAGPENKNTIEDKYLVGFENRSTLSDPRNPLFNLRHSVVGENYADHHILYILERKLRRGKHIPPKRYGELTVSVAEKMLIDPFADQSIHIQPEGIFVPPFPEKTYKEIAGNTRIVKEAGERVNDLPVLETIRLTRPAIKGGWQALLDGDSNVRYADLSRVVVVKDFRNIGKTEEVIKQIVDGKNGVREIAMEMGIDYFLADMSDLLQRHIEKTSFEIVQEVPLNKTLKGWRTGIEYPGYWMSKKHPPHIVIMRFPAQPSDVHA